jgi:aspartyl-tRNA(Asn)/glutamyl-tRNA(Gln) amidotransferase subunit C
MAVTIDNATVTRIAGLARLKITEADKPVLAAQMTNIFAFIDQLDEVDVTGIVPMTGCHTMPLPLRDDVVNDGGNAAAVLANAPQRTGDFFVVPKVVE